ncbi:MAG: hypothetical protein AAF597_17390, partial [Bacteroidota bacterium]
MRASLLFLFLLFIFLAFPSITRAQADLTLSTADVELTDHGSYDFRIPSDIDTLIYPRISFTLQGADGGRARSTTVWENATNVRGGGGVYLTGFEFNLGSGTNMLHPGGILRFIVGQKGENCSNSGGSCGGGGGG